MKNLYQLALFAVIVTVTGFNLVSGEWVLSWSDEFEGEAGSAPDATKWTFDIGNGEDGWGNEEKEYYTDSRNNSALDGEGHLVITAIKDGADQYDCYNGPCGYTSARLKTETTFTQLYGKFEARIILPYGKGTFPAFWLLGDDFSGIGWPYCGEIDVMEMAGAINNTVIGSIHGPGYVDTDGVFLLTYYELPSGSFSDGFHSFILEWSESTITLSVDDTTYFKQTTANFEAMELPWVFDHPFFMLINFAVGGVLDGDPPDDGSVPFPQNMVFDYVRVYSWQ